MVLYAKCGYEISVFKRKKRFILRRHGSQVITILVINDNLMDSRRERSSTNFFFKVFFMLWLGGKGSSRVETGSGSGPSRCSGSARDIGQGLPAKLT